ncbi:MAG: hypothetical protein KAW12_27275 [Candidatus Aminicenantes bacterium]|nr:hypothetical protein [Candidatus Aminicenantes bacterium]
MENWIWSNSPEVDRALGWQEKTPPLRTWLEDKGYFDRDKSKPDPPKEALQKALRNVRKPWSSSIFRQVSEAVSLNRCSDPAFLKLKEKLVQWFSLDVS